MLYLTRLRSRLLLMEHKCGSWSLLAAKWPSREPTDFTLRGVMDAGEEVVSPTRLLFMLPPPLVTHCGNLSSNPMESMPSRATPANTWPDAATALQAQPLKSLPSSTYQILTMLVPNGPLLTSFPKLPYQRAGTVKLIADNGEFLKVCKSCSRP